MARCIVLVLLLVSGVPGVAAANLSEPITALVLDWRDERSTGNEMAQKLADQLSSQLAAVPFLYLIDRDAALQRLGEQKIQAATAAEPRVATASGAATGAQLLISGRIMGGAAKSYAVLRVVGTETDRNYSEVVPIPNSASPEQAAAAIATEIEDIIRHKGVTLIRERADVEQRLKEAKESWNTAALPQLTIEIAEDILGKRSLNPVATREIKVTLEALGFPLAGKGSGQAAEMRVSGKATSVASGDKGQLVCCMARVDVTVLRSSNEVVLSDSQVAYALAPGKTVAAARAIQRAAAKLAERLGTKLASQP